MFIVKVIKGIVNIMVLIAALVMLGTLGEITMDMAGKAASGSKAGFLSISKFNRQLTGTAK
jgi:hypothetical protein